MPLTPNDIDRVIRFWFGDTPEEKPSKDRLKLWFGGGEVIDNEIREKFEPLILSAAAHELESWRGSAKGCMALILVLDQFPLNVYRKTAHAYAFENQAIEVCTQGLQQEFDQLLSINERSFFYLPLEHSEDLDNQNLSVSLFENLHNGAPEDYKPMTQITLDYAIEHRNTIQTFGRYPYRNDVLGRESTKAELSYLEDNPKRYGQ